MLGVGAIFQSKTRADDHWSAVPKIEILEVIEDAEASGDTPTPTPTRSPTLPAAA